MPELECRCRGTAWVRWTGIQPGTVLMCGRSSCKRCDDNRGSVSYTQGGRMRTRVLCQRRDQCDCCRGYGSDGSANAEMACTRNHSRPSVMHDNAPSMPRHERPQSTTTQLGQTAAASLTFKQDARFRAPRHGHTNRRRQPLGGHGDRGVRVGVLDGRWGARRTG